MTEQLSPQPLDVPADPAGEQTRENEAVIREALGVIDQALGQMMQRELVSSGEVADVLLDVRTLLTAPAAERS